MLQIKVNDWFKTKNLRIIIKISKKVKVFFVVLPIKKNYIGNQS